MLKNELLQKADAEVRGKVQDRANVDKIVKAGLKVIYDKAMFAKLAPALKESDDVPRDIAQGVVGVLNILARKARGTMPPVATVSAGMLLMLDALDFAEQAGLVKVDENVLAEATQEYSEAILPSVGLNSERMGQVMKGIEETTSNPERMALYQQSVKGKQQQGGA